jgi:hypothetical protein
LTANYTCGKARQKTFAIEPLVCLLLAEPAKLVKTFFIGCHQPAVLSAVRPEVDFTRKILRH